MLNSEVHSLQYSTGEKINQASEIEKEKALPDYLSSYYMLPLSSS